MQQKDLPRPKIDFFRSNHRAYYIAAGEFVQQSLGLRVPFYLCHILNELGFEAYVTAQKQAPKLRTPLLTQEVINKHKSDGRETVAVYSEAMWGNVLKGDVVVHWIMSAAGKIRERIVGADEPCFYWYHGYSMKNKKDIKPLVLPVLDEYLYNADGVDDSKRSGFAYYAHKYLIEDRKVHDKLTNSGISLCQDIKRTPGEIADILRSVKVLYIYEDSAIAIEAALCGCVVVFVHTEYTRYAIGKQNPEDMYDYCVDEIKLDPNVLYQPNGAVLRKYREQFNDGSGGLADFVKITQSVPLKQMNSDIV